jgi:hypothetical protein
MAYSGVPLPMETTPSDLDSMARPTSHRWKPVMAIFFDILS